jgi:poly-D-alanine transfer protein DltD
MNGKKIVNEKDYRQKSALNHTISELRKNNIKVIVLNMPLNPILSANMSKETRDNYFNYFKSLNSTGTEFYDFEACCSGEYFHDLVHLNDAGRKHFTELLCPIVK